MSELITGQKVKGGTIMEINGKDVSFPGNDSIIISINDSSIVVFDGSIQFTINTWNGEGPVKTS